MVERSAGLMVHLMAEMLVDLMGGWWVLMRVDSSVASMVSQLDEQMAVMLVVQSVDKMVDELVEMMDGVMVALMGCNLVVSMD